MKKIRFAISSVSLILLLTGCLFNEESDREKIVIMTIYPETGYGASVMSDIITQPLVFSDSDDNQRQMLTDIITEGFDFEYKRGFEYSLKVKKIWMQEPPQDVSSVKYVFIELLSADKVITEDSEKESELFVSPQTVKFMPAFPKEYETGEEGMPKIYDALHVKENGTNNWMALTEIEGFHFEEGYEYVLNVKKVTTAEPYRVKYVLLSVLSKKEKI